MPELAWVSPLGLSVALFLAAAALQVAIGAATVAYHAARGFGGTLYFTPRSDAAVLGEPPEALLARAPGLRTVRDLIWVTIAGFLAAVGVLEAALAWFALREGAAWALGALAVEGVVLAAAAALVVRTYRRHGAPLGGHVPPFLWATAGLRAPAIALGAWALA